MNIELQNKENNANKCRILIYFIALLCVISNISYYPFFQATGWARYVVIISWSIILLYTLFVDNLFIKSKYFNKQSLFFIVFVLCSFFLYLMGQNDIFTNHFFLIVVISYFLFVLSSKIGQNINTLEVKVILLTYSFSVVIISVPLYFIYLRGYDLSSLIYQYSYGKNEIAILIMCSFIIISLYYNPIGKPQIIIKVASLFILLLNIIFLRCRSAMVGIVICFMLYIKHWRVNKYLKFVTLILIATILMVSQLNKLKSFRDDVLFAGRTGYDLDDLSSGRITQITYGLTLLKDNLLIGVGKNRTIDCLYISALVNYGLIFFIPIILLALYPIGFGINNYIINRKKLRSEDICYLALSLSMLTTSCLEELAPFGPGTRCYIFWLMFGIMINIKKGHENECINEENFTY